MELKKSLFAFLSTLTGPTAYAAILGVLLACGLGLPLPEDITLVSAGLLAGMGNISLTGALIAGFIGVLAGDTILFLIGRKFGRRVFTIPIFSGVFKPELIQRAEKRIQQNAHLICFTARFLPGLRAPIYLTAGIMRVRFLVFILQDGLAALLSVPLWVLLGYWAGQNFDAALDKAKELHIYVLVGVAVLVVFFIIKRRAQRSQKKN